MSSRTQNNQTQKTDQTATDFALQCFHCSAFFDSGCLLSHNEMFSITLKRCDYLVRGECDSCYQHENDYQRRPSGCLQLAEFVFVRPRVITLFNIWLQASKLTLYSDSAKRTALIYWLLVACLPYNSRGINFTARPCRGPPPVQQFHFSFTLVS